ncbi:cytochrome P450 [Hypoxylon argillaceum]|nr:cytochrome P450 [Hypoxylon argillaceum]
MQDPTMLIRVSGALVVGYILQRLLRSLLSPLRAVPGPFLARCSDLWYLWHVKRGHWEIRNIELHRKHGPAVRYGSNRYSFSDPDALGDIYGHGTRFAKSSWYDAWVPPDGWSLFGDRSIQRHANTRRQLQSTYSMTSLVSYEPYVDQCSEIFSRRLSEMSTAGTPVDMGHWLQCYAFDVIGQITYGKRIGFLDRGVDVQGIMSAIESGLAYGTFVGIYARFHRVAFALVNFLAGKKGAGREYIVGLSKTRIAEEQKKRKTTLPPDEAAMGAEPFVSKLLSKYEQDPEKFTMQHVLAGCTANMAAGSDTTGISLSAILYYLLRHPKSLQQLRREIAEFQEQGSLSNSFSFKETQQMPYLQAVIKETLRIHPATGLSMERVVPQGGATISGRFFPEGTIVGVNSWVVHRNTQIFGEDADEFNPERWLVNNGDKLAAMNRQWIPFGMGSRTCIGRHISTLEISKLIPRIVRDFDFELSSGNAKDLWATQNHWFVKPREFQVKVMEREPEYRHSENKG